jgi:hypothetical protein
MLFLFLFLSGLGLLLTGPLLNRLFHGFAFLFGERSVSVAVEAFQRALVQLLETLALLRGELLSCLLPAGAVWLLLCASLVWLPAPLELLVLLAPLELLALLAPLELLALTIALSLRCILPVRRCATLTAELLSVGPLAGPTGSLLPSRPSPAYSRRTACGTALLLAVVGTGLLPLPPGLRLRPDSQGSGEDR